MKAPIVKMVAILRDNIAFTGFAQIRIQSGALSGFVEFPPLIRYFLKKSSKFNHNFNSSKENF